MPSRESRRRRRQRRADHLYRGVDGLWTPRVAFAGELDAVAATRRVLDATGRRYVAFPCTWLGCDSWHIRACRRRHLGLTRSA